MNKKYNLDFLKISDFLKRENAIFKIPVYQRNYSWNKQVNTLLNDIYDSTLDSGFFIGVIFCSEGKNEEILIVDGQQRLVTISIILSTILKILDRNLKEEAKNETEENKSKTKLLMEDIEECIFKNQKIKNKLKLQTYKDKNILGKVLDKDYSPKNLSNDEKKHKLVDSSKKINDFFKDKDTSDIIEFAKKLLKTNLVCLNLSEFEVNRNELFEAFNSKNEPLKNFDLITNLIFMKIENEELQEKIYREEWENQFQDENGEVSEKFLRDFISMKTLNKAVDKGYDIYERFKNMISKFEAKNNEKLIDEIKKLIREMKKFYEIYNFIKTDSRIKKTYGKLDIDEQRLFEYKFLGVDSADSFIMYLIDRLIDKKLIPGHFDLLIKHITNYLYKKKIMGPTAQNRILFIEILKKCKEEENNEKNNRNWIFDIFTSTIKNHTDKGDNFRNNTNKEFMDSVKIGFKKHEDSKLFFVLLNDNLKTGFKPKTIDEFKNITVEHIVPQAFKKIPEWTELMASEKDTFNLNKISNLTILSEPENSKTGSKIFDKKMKIIPTSIFKINLEMASYKNISDLDEKWFKYLKERYSKTISEIT
ncbi:hypothetical protein SSABA_v1c04280 [Spiroplasma sabaudiense Ar-1343]|uniref:DUF262 domain-containing protein n=1 Tax=Spiroplasma sabaudiense Ar-1343 TaxID=1276257 RepID=W6A9W9_9MOLU|nr:DUF262 domain-containing protein [Spiroplasma sabaudiense]AHI53837.1 hypothetical protein SSABA_v1c04280 [Spiroplasma sabaudiense Ar-1343]